MSEIQPETAPGEAPVTQADIGRLQAEIDDLKAAKEAGQPAGAIDAQIAEKEAAIASADPANTDETAEPAADAETDRRKIAAYDLGSNTTTTGEPDSVNVTVYVADAIYTGTLSKQ